MKAISVGKVLGLVFFVGLGFSCSFRTALIPPDPHHITGHTAGEISRQASVGVEFSRPVGEEPGTLPDRSPFRFSPKVEGEVYWKDRWHLEFKPSHLLRHGTEYTVHFDPEAIGLPEIEPFSFLLRTIPREFKLLHGSLIVPDPLNPGMMEYRGAIRSSDVVHPQELKKYLKSRYGRGNREIIIDGEEAGTAFNFRITQIRKKSGDALLRVWVSGIRPRSAGFREKIPVPACSDFSVLSIEPHVQDEKYIEMTFSDPLSISQQLAGLITCEQIDNVRLVRQSNTVKMFSPGTWPAKVDIQVSDSLENQQGIRLAQGYGTSVAFPREKPRVRFIGNGVIVPTSQGTSIPIETMNLNALMVQAIQIYGDNVHQFLQVNKLDQGSEINRVGEVVWQKVIDLDWDAGNIDKWVRYGLDISPLLRKDPKGLFQLRLTFRRPHIQYPCEATAEDERFLFEGLASGPGAEAEASLWDAWQPSNYYQNRMHRSDPCHPAYYWKWHDHDITVVRNVMISDVGLIAHKAADGTLQVFASDLRSTAPLPGVSLTAYNFQRRRLAAVRTDRNGFAAMNLGGSTPFFVLAQNGDQYGYLRLDEATALSVSHFDVGGTNTIGGVQGFLYGERGVWRPGDAIHLFFVLFDPDNRLPEHHPVVFQLIDPLGKVIETQTLPPPVENFYSIPLRTGEDAPTGNWLARCTVGGNVFERTLKIEAVMPNRLKIDLSFDTNKDYLTNGRISGSLSAKWLHGAIAGNLQADVSIAFSPTTTGFDGLEEFIFDDPSRSFSSDPRLIFKGTLDRMGQATFHDYLNITGSPGALTAAVTTRVFEPGGAFSSEYVNINFHPYERYVGIKVPKGDVARGMLLTDTDHQVDIVLVDRDGARVSSAELRAELFKINWRWWWETGPENLSVYMAKRGTQPVDSGSVRIQNGRGTWKLRVNYPQWGRYLLRVTDNSSGHSTGKILYIDWPGWAGRGQDEASGGAAMLVLSTDKKKYNTGESVRVSIPSNPEGRCLITTESRGRILKSEWIKSVGSNTVYSFTATPEMAPNVYIHASYIQPHLQTLNDRPIRSYGVIPVSIENPNTHLKPVISTASVFKPGETVQITVSEAHGNPMTYTLALVDEGLLGITRYATPDPWDHFYRKQSSLLKSWDLYDYVAGAYSGTLNTLLAIGGGEEGEGGGRKKLTRFEPVVIVLPPTKLERGSRRTHTIRLPQYVGAVRAMVVAGSQSAFGASEKMVPVRTDLMVLGTLPRVLSPNEEINVPVTIFALDEKVRNVSLSIETEGPVSVIGQTYELFRVEAVGESERSFRIRTQNSTGEAKILIRAKSGDSVAVSTTEITIRSPAPMISRVEAFTLEGGRQKNQRLELPGMPGTNSLTLELSRIPPLDLAHRLGYLIRYPHGCIEQTVSSVFPQVFLGKITHLTQEEARATQSNIERGIERLRFFQTPQGGFAYWPGQDHASDWGTTYTGHFLLEAKTAGFHIPQNMYGSWLNFQKMKANSWYGTQPKELREQAYRLYTLALAGEPDLGAMNRLREYRQLPDMVKWRLAAAYALAGRGTEAKRLTMQAGTEVAAYTELSGTFGNDLRDKAMILEALVCLGSNPEARGLAGEISEVLTSGRSMSTQTTAYALIALFKFGFSDPKSERLEVWYAWNNSPTRQATSDKPVLQQRIEVGSETEGTLTVANKGVKALYPRIILQGVPEPGKENDESRSLVVSVRYEDFNQNSLYPRTMQPGTDLRAIVQVVNPTNRKYEELILTHLVPAGWEIHNIRLTGTGSGADYDYRDIRDDRVYTYFDLEANASKTFVLMANAAYSGRFYLPLIKCEAMYDPDILAIVKGRWISIGE